MTDQEQRCDYWLSNRQFTVLVQVDGGDRIITAAPIVRRFVGQPMEALRRWSEQRFGATDIRQLGGCHAR